MIIPVMPAVNAYVSEVQALLRAQGLHADIDVSGNTMQKKIRTAQLALYNFIIVVGAEERENKAANVRNRDDMESQKRGEVIPLDEVVRKLVALRDGRGLENKI
jgi:threonyl-tRNA synthetase